MPRRTNTQFTEDELVALAFEELHLSRNTWHIELVLLDGWMGLKVRRKLGRSVERGASFTAKTSASERKKKFLELVRSAVDELSIDPG
ncbi:hypothetical protein [Hyalangium rubrum]|uniref:Uncharacterized protein n=1 Tax=Hyalangium rubrum TaxID=3103134 RepID=A0ABU5H0Q2_9BACT|nr:hypothetical protein [Hyalangium sp. s54d21]MDY7227030.1 hypothetical protein [Hyalangium sp. s54d21]